MTHGPEHHLEEAEHAQHAAHDPLDRKVAMTMAIVAAVLALITMVSHREHNATLRYQTQANIHHTQASDQWGYFQAKKNRAYLYEALADLLELAGKDPESAKAAERIKSWKAKAAKYELEAKEIEERAHQLERGAENLQEDSEHAHHRGDRFDLGELGVELSLVVCSVAVLTKNRKFWYAGILFGLLGAGVAASRFFAL